MLGTQWGPMLEGKFPKEEDAPDNMQVQKMMNKLKDGILEVEKYWYPIKPLNEYDMLGDFKKILGKIDDFKKTMALPKGEK